SSGALFYDNTAIATGGTGGGIAFGGIYTGSSYTQFAAITSHKDTVTDGQYGAGLAFYTRVNGSGGWADKTAAKMFLSSAGYLGIGTAGVAATSPLQVVTLPTYTSNATA